MDTDVKKVPESEEQQATPENQTEVQKDDQEAEAQEETQEQKAGDKTDPNLLLKSLKEEREKRRLLEQELSELKEVRSQTDYSGDDERIARLETALKSIQEKEIFAEVLSKFPDLKDFKSEFEEYRKDFPSTKTEAVAKLFLSEKGLLGTARKGLEKTTGGNKTAHQTGMSADEVKTLRETNFRKYQQMIVEGKIKV